jgi:hypothetical protein
MMASDSEKLKLSIRGKSFLMVETSFHHQKVLASAYD